LIHHETVLEPVCGGDIQRRGIAEHQAGASGGQRHAVNAGMAQGIGSQLQRHELIRVGPGERVGVEDAPDGRAGFSFHLGVPCQPGKHSDQLISITQLNWDEVTP